MTARATKTKKGVEVSLETVLWSYRVTLCGVGVAGKNRDAIIGLVPSRFVGDRLEKHRKELLDQYGDISVFLEKPSFYNAMNALHLKEITRWSYIVKNTSANNIAIIIDRAITDIEEGNPPLKGALTLDLLATLGVDKAKIKDPINNINQIDGERFQEEDLIGRVYEYLPQVYAAFGTKEDEEFHTPAYVIKLIAETTKLYGGTVYNLCCGSGGVFVQSMKFVNRYNGNRQKISIIGRENQVETWRLYKINLAIRGITHNLGGKNTSTFTEDLHKGKKANFIVVNPPSNLKNWCKKDEFIGDPGFMKAGFSAVSPAPSANYAWILHMLNKLDVNHGITRFLLANGVLGADGVEYTLREELIEKDKIEAITVFPRDIFYTVDLSCILRIMNMNKKTVVVNGHWLRDKTSEILFIDLGTWNDNSEETVTDKDKKKRKTVLVDEQVSQVRVIYSSQQSDESDEYKDVPEFYKFVKLKGRNGICKSDYSLAPSEYIEFVDHDLGIDYKKEMARIQKEMVEVMRVEKQSQQMLEDAFRGIGYGID